jgi:hypothetical protein
MNVCGVFFVRFAKHFKFYVGIPEFKTKYGRRKIKQNCHNHDFYYAHALHNTFIAMACLFLKQIAK